MRRLRRAHQRHAKQQAKRRKKFKQRAMAAGTAAAITLTTGLGLKAFANAADEHQLTVSQDADADLLANTEEVAIGYRVFEGDQNRSEVPDGVELAKRCVADINDLPTYDPHSGDPEPNETYRIDHPLRGVETCDICSTALNMGGAEIINPKLGLRYPDPNDSLGGEFLPFLALHYMEHGSFDCFGHVGGGPWHVGRVDVPRLLRVLELRFPYEPNEHQLPLDYTGHTPTSGDPIKQLAPDANDLDGDLLADSEELAAGFNLYNPDQDNDITPDGIELAKQCRAAIDQLPNSVPPDPDRPYKLLLEADGYESCEICGYTITMDHWDIVNPRLGLTTHVPVMAAHYMEHGSLSYAATEHSGRVDIPLLLRILEMPRQCGDLGTMYLPQDLNQDCKVDGADFAQFADKWLDSTEPVQD